MKDENGSTALLLSFRLHNYSVNEIVMGLSAAYEHDFSTICLLAAGLFECRFGWLARASQIDTRSFSVASGHA